MPFYYDLSPATRNWTNQTVQHSFAASGKAYGNPPVRGSPGANNTYTRAMQTPRGSLEPWNTVSLGQRIPSSPRLEADLPSSEDANEVSALGPYIGLFPAPPRSQTRPNKLDPAKFHALIRRSNVVTFWLRVDDVLRGLPGEENVPRGQWQLLVDLAREVAFAPMQSNGPLVQNQLREQSLLADHGQSCGERLIVSWCHIDEPVGGQYM
jgi:hypothetical protein